MTNKAAPDDLRPRARAALARSEALLAIPWRPRAFVRRAPTRWLALGDPQTTRARLFTFLDDAGALGDDGDLADDVGLVCVGDYFDFHGDPAHVAREGLGALRWLAEQPPDRCVLLVGNHDLCRVMELEMFDDASFGEARAFALSLEEAAKRGAPAADETFAERYPDLPTPGLIRRDFQGFSVAQRALVKRLLLAHRAVLAVAATLPGGREALVTHAGVTVRELDLLALSEVRAPKRIASRLRGVLRDAVERVAPSWRDGRAQRLVLAPLHEMGGAEDEGGGLLYHRPANPDETTSDRAWSFDPSRPRRFDPRTLPDGLVQVCGHTGHSKCLRELGSWATDDARRAASGGLRTLSVSNGAVRYSPGIEAPQTVGATLYLIDGEMARREVTECLLFALDGVEVPAESLGPVDDVEAVFDAAERVCGRCAHRRNMVALGQGLRCAAEANRSPEGALALIPTLAHGCASFARREG